MEEDSQSSQPLPIQQLPVPTFSNLKTVNLHSPTNQNNNRSLFILPIEIRAKIYRHILISRLDCGSHPRLWRPVGVDGVILRIGYFERDTVIPLLLVCRQMFVIRVPIFLIEKIKPFTNGCSYLLCRHDEGAAILYGENTFAFHISGLATDGKIAFLEYLAEKYVRLLKKVYIRTGYGIDTYGLRSDFHSAELRKDESPTPEQVQRKIGRDLAVSMALLKEAWPARYRVCVNRDVTVDMPGEDDVRLLGKQKVTDWPASAYHLWRMFLVEGEDGETRREFRRVWCKGVS